MDFKGVVHWAEKNPSLAALVVFGVGLVLLWALGFFKGGSGSSGGSSSGSSADASYLQAVAASTTSGNALAAQQNLDQTNLAIANGQNTLKATLAQISADLTNNANNDNLQAATIQSNNATTLGVTQSNNSLTAALAQNSTVAQHNADDYQLGILAANNAVPLANIQANQNLVSTLAPIIANGTNGQISIQQSNGTVFDLGNAGWVGPPQQVSQAAGDVLANGIRNGTINPLTLQPY